MARQKKGRGWHGNSAAHAAAGRKGGLASRRGKKSKSQIDEYEQATM